MRDVGSYSTELRTPPQLSGGAGVSSAILLMKLDNHTHPETFNSQFLLMKGFSFHKVTNFIYNLLEKMMNKLTALGGQPQGQTCG